VFEEFDFVEALLGLFERLVGATEILALAREYLIPPFTLTIISALLLPYKIALSTIQ